MCAPVKGNRISATDMSQSMMFCPGLILRIARPDPSGSPGPGASCAPSSGILNSMRPAWAAPTSSKATIGATMILSFLMASSFPASTEGYRTFEVLLRGFTVPSLRPDEAAAHFRGARDLAIVGVELIVQDEEALDLRARHHLVLSERSIHFGDMFLDHVIDQRMAGEFLIRYRIERV